MRKTPALGWEKEKEKRRKIGGAVTRIYRTMWVVCASEAGQGWKVGLAMEPSLSRALPAACRPGVTLHTATAVAANLREADQSKTANVKQAGSKSPTAL